MGRGRAFFVVQLFFIFLIICFAFVIGAAHYIEFEPILMFIIFTFFMGGVFVRIAGVLGSRNYQRFIDKWEFFKFSVLLSAINTVLIYPLYIVLRFLFSPFIPTRHLTSIDLFQPWLSILYIGSGLYTFSIFMYVSTKMDFVKAKEYLVVKLETPFMESGKYFEGGQRALARTYFLILIPSAFMVITPLFYFIDVIRGWERPPIPLESFIPMFLSSLSILLYVIDLTILFFALKRISIGNYYMRRILLESKEEASVEEAKIV